MPEEIRQRMEHLKKMLPGLDDLSLAMVAGYADGYAARVAREEQKHGEVPDQRGSGGAA